MLIDDDFKRGLFYLDEAVGCFMQARDNPIAYLFERLASTMVMSQEECVCEDEFESEVDQVCVDLNNKINRMK